MWHAVLNVEGSLYKMSGLPGIPAEIENSKMLVRGDEIEYDQDTGDVRAEGHVYFRDFEKNEQIWASRLEYNTEDKEGANSGTSAAKRIPASSRAPAF